MAWRGRDVTTLNWYLSICPSIDIGIPYKRRLFDIFPLISAPSYRFFLHSSRPRFLAATRFYYPGRGSSQFSLASHNSRAESVSGISSSGHAERKRERGSHRELPLILKVWQSAGGVSSLSLLCRSPWRTAEAARLSSSPKTISLRWRRFDEKKRHIVSSCELSITERTTIFHFFSPSARRRGRWISHLLQFFRLAQRNELIFFFFSFFFFVPACY